MIKSLKMGLVALVTAVALTACTPSVEDTVSKNVMTKVREAAYDSENIKFKNIATVVTEPKESEFTPADGKYALTCAEINGKNRMGGFTGYKFNMFITSITDVKNIEILQQVDDSKDFLTDDYNEDFKAMALIFPKSTLKCLDLLKTQK